jgi:formate dehydrogenase subunit gamma
MGALVEFSDWDGERAAAIIAAEASREGGLICVLQALQASFGHVPDEAVPLVTSALNQTRAEVHGVLTFYRDFRRTPAPPHILKLCGAEACQARGGEAIAALARQRLEARTDVEVETVFCLGLCASGPAAMLDGRLAARLTSERLDRLLSGAGA